MKYKQVIIQNTFLEQRVSKGAEFVCVPKIGFTKKEVSCNATIMFFSGIVLMLYPYILNFFFFKLIYEESAFAASIVSSPIFVGLHQFMGCFVLMKMYLYIQNAAELESALKIKKKHLAFNKVVSEVNHNKMRVEII